MFGSTSVAMSKDCSHINFTQVMCMATMMSFKIKTLCLFREILTLEQKQANFPANHTQIEANPYK